MIIRKATEQDKDPAWTIIKAVIADGDTYVFEPGSSKEEMLAYWFSPSTLTYVAELDGEIVGTFILKENQPGLGSHVANASYMTSPHYRGKGIGRQMGVFSLNLARDVGFLSIQFNLVVKSNEAAIHLWKELGFEIIGELPEAFNHSELGLTNAYVMSRRL
ncbi:MAG: GNAT family N-acetyltransferase [Balneolales bacterium]|nr:GNAT family N-acetyltransferase [Balneolales bacterium]